MKFKVVNFANVFAKPIALMGSFIAVVFVCTLSACKTNLYTPATADTQEEAASTHIAVLTVARWDDCKADLQPKFDMSSATALDAAMPVTFGLEEKLLNALSAKLKIALPGTTFSSTDLNAVAQSLMQTNSAGYKIGVGTNGAITSTSDISGGASQGSTTSNQRSASETYSSGNISNITFEASPDRSRTAASLSGASVLNTAPKTDAMLRYWAATAIFQEVNLINRYVKDAAIADNYVPYLVRLQVSIMPRKRNLPYDAYSVLSFFPGKFGPSTGQTLTVQQSAADSSEKEAVKVLPLLVTDDIESALHSRSVDDMRQLALGLSAVIQGVGLGADLQKMNEELRTVLGYDFNSTFTVGRVSDNTIQCRFGALNQAAAHFAMIPQTHNVTLVVLVPKDKANQREPFARDMRVICKTELVHATNGEKLPSNSQTDYYEKTRATLEDHGFGLKKYKLSNNEIGDILRSVAANDFKQFQSLLGAKTPDSKKYFEAVWVDLCQLRNTSQLGSVEFQVPASKPEPCFFPNAKNYQTVDATDNGKALNVSVWWLENVAAAKLGAFVTISGTGKKDLLWPATALDVQGDGRFLHLSFPSPASVGYTNADGSTTFTLTLFSLDRSETFKEVIMATSRLEKGKEEKPESDKLGFEIALRATLINAYKQPTNGIEGVLDVIVSQKSPQAKISLEVDKADVVSVLPADKVKQNGSAWELATNATYTVQFRNLNPIEPVVITAKDASNKASPFVRTVRVQLVDKSNQ